tara:strand:+ start:2897 stop:3196 length:300 start_codon:yes stop_codon:yes gene_type:complete
MKNNNLESFIEQATENITDDRAATKALLMNLMQYMQTADDHRHREFGLIAAKYLETLQRSNEQLVKLASLIQKKEKTTEGISDQDRQDLFDLINNDGEQ